MPFRNPLISLRLPEDQDTPPYIDLDGETGIITVISANGQKITINPNTTNPEIRFHSPDGTNQAYINSPNLGQPDIAELGMNSGISTPGDGIPRRYRLFLNANANVGHLAAIRESNALALGGVVAVADNQLFLGYQDVVGGIASTMQFLNNHINVDVLGVRIMVLRNNALELGNIDVSFEGGRAIGRGVIASYSEDGGVVIATATGARVLAATLPSTVTFRADRAYRFTLRGWFGAPAGQATANLSLRRVDINGQELVTIQRHDVPAGGFSVSEFAAQIRQGLALANQTIVIALGGGTVPDPVQLLGTFTPLALQVLIEDVGLAADYPDHPTI